jgi:hypothetical protein
MGQTTSTPSTLQTCLSSALPTGAYKLPSSPLYQLSDVHPYNLGYQITPAAVTYPQTKEHVQSIVKCASASGKKVQARGGGHSYANYCLGGQNDAVVLDMKNFRQFSIDQNSWHATIGSGFLLANVTDQLHAYGRAMAHGTCPQVGIGGHATIGGLGPSSRMWGSALDHVVEVEIVTADGNIQRASETQNADLFFAVKGAGASFGAVTEFVVKTEPEPAQTIQYSYSFSISSDAKAAAAVFKAWKSVISRPDLDRRFASQLNIIGTITTVSGTFFGSRAEFDALNLQSIFPQAPTTSSVTLDDWLGTVAHWAEDAFLHIGGGLPSYFYSKSIAFTPDMMLTDDGVDKMYDYLYNTGPKDGRGIWVIIFDLEGGAVNDVPLNATAYPHRDTIFFMQSYAVNILPGSMPGLQTFLTGLDETVRASLPGGGKGALSYAGYVDPLLGSDGPRAYWGSNLDRLVGVKDKWDGGNVFANLQSVPTSTSQRVMAMAKTKARKAVKVI